MRIPKLLWISLASLLLACGAESSPEAEPAAEEVEAPPEEAEPLPEPEPEPEPIAECPTDTWAVGANGGENQAAGTGVEASGFVRSGLRAGWTRISICKTIEENEVQMICSPTAGGAECNIGFSDRICSGTLPNAVVPIAAGQLVDTSEVPSEGQWRCTDR